MKKIILSCFLIGSSISLFAQQKSYVVTRDTINLRGYIYDNSGKPVNFIHIESTQLETEHNTFKLGTYTNDRGFFELKGAKFNDTLTIGPDIHYDIPPIFNKGSRYFMVYLPLPKVVDITASAPLVIEQKRKYPKVTPSFTVTPATNLANNDNVTSTPQYPGGIAQLQDYIKKNIQYPESAVKNNLEGIVQISFTVTKDGNHKDYKILRGVSDDCDNEVLRVIKKSPKWQPALDHDQPVAMQETLAILFKLTDN